MAKYPNSPGAAALARLQPQIVTLPEATTLARVYYSRSRHALSWNQFRHHGPLDSRWDHHLPDAAHQPVTQERGIYYAAADALTCLAEFFQAARRIDRAYQSPWLVIFDSVSTLDVLDLTGAFATRMGASMAIHSGSRVRARAWARDLYEAFPEVQGVLYAASMHGGQPALALNERALRKPLFARRPRFHRALADDLLLDPLKQAAYLLGYALR